MSRKTKDLLIKSLILASTAFTVGILVIIIGYITVRGFGALSLDFIFGSAENGGIWPMIVSTMYIVGISLSISVPIGIMAAIYLTEYAKQTKFVSLIRLATQSLSGIPSIIFGLFGLAFFVRNFGLNISILSAGLTLSIMNLPVIIRATEEALKSVPQSYREGSLGLGATKIHTIWKVVLPSALPGILTAVILAIGRIVGESAPVLLTAGVLKDLPTSIFDGGRTLTVHLYLLAQEAISPEDLQIAFATATVLIIIVLVINLIARFVSAKLDKTKA
ncbi:MAG: phosphate ABC transporter permease PstA [Culicoidibacterales bacterium]